MQKSAPLIHTKLRLPVIRPELVPRPRLQKQIAQGLRGPLTLITAPAGFGKTTLVASCITSCRMPIAWLSLDKNDNQAGRFLNYLVATLQEADPMIGDEAAQLATAPQPAPPKALLTSLINDLDSTGKEIALVLDDYQFIKSQAVHEAVAFLLEHGPHTLHMVISTRSDPPLALARLRVRSQTVELRAADLSFTETEAAQFLNDVMGLRLDAGSVATLEERTEGWIAGLQMAALSMRDRKDVAGFIKGFSGTNRYILDYLLEEVLASQSPEIQRFLLHTSILERLTAPLCDAVLDVGLADDEGAKREGDDRSSRSESLFFHQSASILEYLERANLFLVPLDDERIWYRYHHLFADLLRARLDQLNPGLSPRLHAHAATWLEREGMTVEAVNHALAAGEYDRAARLVEANTSRLLAQGELNALMGWIATLPAELRLSRPWLCVHQASALMFAGLAAEVEPLLAQAEAALGAEAAQGRASLAGQADKMDSLSMGVSEARALRGAMAAMRAYTAVILGQDAEVLSQGQLAYELLPAEELGSRSLVAWATGRTLQTQGRLTEARLAFEEHVRLGRAMGHIWALLAGLTALAQVLLVQGQLPQARALLEEALAEASQQGARSRGYIAWVEDGLANVLYEQNELEAARRLLAEAIELIRQWPNPNHLIYAYALQSRVLLAQGDLEGARTSIGEADQIRRNAPLSRWLRRTAEAELVRVWLALRAAGISLVPGDALAEQSSALVASWRSELADLEESDNRPMDECAQIAALTLARVSSAAGRAEEALTWLDPVTRRTQAAGYIGAPIESLVLTAIAWQSNPAGTMPGSGRSVRALTALEEALTLAEPGGYVRVFLDEGRPMQMLLAQWLAHAGASSLREYAIHLLSQFDDEPEAATAAQEKTSPTGEMVEPLSQREMEVLYLIALGKTNQEIAGQLIVSSGTVKAHTASIYRKLDVANRTEAVARARQFGILP
jgi:LuxR family transcriptional regulator, maltose regulon positive regulatory protein